MKPAVDSGGGDSFSSRRRRTRRRRRIFRVGVQEIEEVEVGVGVVGEKIGTTGVEEVVMVVLVGEQKG